LLASSQRCQLNETGADPILRSAAAAFFHEPDITVELPIGTNMTGKLEYLYVDLGRAKADETPR